MKERPGEGAGFDFFSCLWYLVTNNEGRYGYGHQL